MMRGVPKCCTRVGSAAAAVVQATAAVTYTPWTAGVIGSKAAARSRTDA